MTCEDLIKVALQDIGVLAAGDETGDDDEDLALLHFNLLLGSLSAEKVFIPFHTYEGFPLVIADADYSIGSGGDFDTVRPFDIEAAFVRDTGGIDYPVAVRPFSEYMNISDKDVAGRPYKIFYNPTYPTGTIYTYYVANAVETLYLLSKKHLTSISVASSTISLPDEYLSLLHPLLVESLAGPFGKALTDIQTRAARRGRSIVRGINIANSMKPVNLSDMPGGISTYNIDEG